MSGSVIKHRKAAALLAAGVLALSMASAGSAAAAPAAPERCTIKGFKPGTFVVNATDTERLFSVQTTGCTQKNWTIHFIEGGRSLLAKKSEPVITFLPDLLANNLAGSHKVEVAVKSSDDVTTKKTLSFSLKRRSTFGTSFNLSPEPAESGDKLKVVGTLKRVSWGSSPKYVAYSGRTVQLQFKAKGATTYVNKKALTTNSAGKISSTVKVTKTGTWRLRYGGNSTTGAAYSGTDAVTVS